MHSIRRQCSELRALHSAVRRITYSQSASRQSLFASFCRAQIAPTSQRSLHTSSPFQKRQNVPNEPPPTDFQELDVLGNTPAPSTSVDVCMEDGFGLNSGITITGGDGALLVNGEAFSWRPWVANGNKPLVNKKGQFEIPAEALSMFDMLWPRPDLLIIGVGRGIIPLSPETRTMISEKGLRVEILDTRNAASQFNMLATERGVSEVAAALVPIGYNS